MWRGYADAAFALADETTDPTPPRPRMERPRGRAHFRGDFEAAAERVAARRRHRDDRGGALTTLGRARGDVRRSTSSEARALLDRAEGLMAPIGSLSQHAYRAYVEGEWRAPTSIDDADALLPPGHRARLPGGHRLRRGRRAGLARRRPAARRGHRRRRRRVRRRCCATWRRTGHNTQLWTTARNAAELLAAAGRRRPAALLLICAEDAPGAAAVGPEIARFSARAFVRLSDLALSVAGSGGGSTLGAPRSSTAPRRSCARSQRGVTSSLVEEGALAPVTKPRDPSADLSRGLVTVASATSSTSVRG